MPHRVALGQSSSRERINSLVSVHVGDVFVRLRIGAVGGRIHDSHIGDSLVESMAALAARELESSTFLDGEGPCRSLRNDHRLTVRLDDESGPTWRKNVVSTTPGRREGVGRLVDVLRPP